MNIISIVLAAKRRVEAKPIPLDQAIAPKPIPCHQI